MDAVVHVVSGDLLPHEVESVANDAVGNVSATNVPKGVAIVQETEVPDTSSETSETPEAVDTILEVINNAPEVVNTATEVVNTAPEVINTALETVDSALDAVHTPTEIVNTTPEVVCTAPEVISTAPEVANTTLEAVNTATEVVTAPGVNNAAHEIVDSALDAVNAPPEIANTAPEAVYIASEVVSTAPEVVNTSPEVVNATLETVNTALEAVNTALEAVNISAEIVNPSLEASPSIGTVAQASDASKTIAATESTQAPENVSDLDTVQRRSLPDPAPPNDEVLDPVPPSDTPGTPELGSYSSTALSSPGSLFDHVDGHPPAVDGHRSRHGLQVPGPLAENGLPPVSFPQVPIAVCGIALRLPGGIRTTEAFWDVLHSGSDLRGPIPASRFNIDGFDGSLGGHKGAIGTHHGYFLEEDLACLDTSFFSMGRTELEKMDPQERQLLEVTRECLENAGETDYRGKMVGCYVGTFGDDWERLRAKESLQCVGGYNFSADLVLANRVSYEFNFKGPSMVIKTGCSASLVGLHEACRALQSGDCGSAVVAGTSLLMSPTIYSIMTSEGILSPEGSCKTFDAAADGFARAEGINAVYLKRLDDALRDGNPIRAVIRNSGINNDGKSKGLLSPDAGAQEALIRHVYAQAGLDPAQTAFMECHGTGTATGDPIETTAVGNVFGENGIYIGSVKPNVGHSEGASGLTSLIKAILALEHKTIPPNIKFSQPNPKIPFAEKKLQVPVKPMPWPSDRAERISVNSFGIGGTNAHVIVESAASVQPGPRAASQPQGPRTGQQLLILSANNQDALKTLADRTLQHALAASPSELADIAYTLSQRREHLPQRAYVVVPAPGDGSRPPDGEAAAGAAIPAPVVSPFAKAPAEPPKVAMVFSGQGAQWPRMAAELLDADEVFRRDIQEMDAVLKGLRQPPSWDIEAELRKPKDTSKVYGAELSQPLCTAVQVAMVNALRRRGVVPAAVIGHSSGEIAAAYAAGALTLREAIVLAYYRGHVAALLSTAGSPDDKTSVSPKGAMAAIGLGAAEVQAYLVEGVVVAAENSPQSTTVSGDFDKVDALVAAVKSDHPDTLARKLAVDVAYHSHHMDGPAERYLALITAEFESVGGFEARAPAIPFFSTVHARKVTEPFELTYWPLNLTSPVRFCPGATALLADIGAPMFVEIGPHSQMQGPLRQICAGAGKAGSFQYVASMIRGADCQTSLLSAFGQLFQAGTPVDFSSLIPRGKVVTNLPLYPWDRSSRYWYESRVSLDWRSRKFAHHPLLGQRIPESTWLEPSWRCVLDLEDEPWLHDHKLRDDIVFPFAGYVAMAGEAVRQVTAVTGGDGSRGYSVRHVIAHQALLLYDSKPVEVVTTLRRRKLTDSSDSEYYDFSISSYTGSSWVKNCDGQVKALAADAAMSPPEIKKLPRKVASGTWYDVLARTGLVFGPEFKRLQSVTASPVENRAVSDIGLPKTAREAYIMHPTAIDGALQLTFAARTRGAARAITQLVIPSVIEEIDVLPNPEPETGRIMAEAWSFTSPKEDVGATCVSAGNARQVVLRIRGMRLAAIEEDKADEGGTARVDRVDRHAAARMRWFPDIDFADLSTLFDAPPADRESRELLEELTLYCLLDSEERVRGLEPCQPHFNKFRQWLARERKHADEKRYPILGDVSEALALTAEERAEKIKSLSAYIMNNTKANPALNLGLIRINDNIEDIFTGKIEALQVLLEGNVLAGIYDSVSFGFHAFVRSLCVSRAGLRILEVGAGTGGTTDRTLRPLISDAVSGSNPPYAVYTFTDVSAGFFPQARERFAYAPNMEFRVFDITADPASQGFELGSYDVVLASNVVHATPVLAETLANLRTLLKPDGFLALCEACADGRAAGYVYGNFEGWWLGEADGRQWEPYVSVERWDEELRKAGFSDGIAASVTDYDMPFQLCAAIVARASPKPRPAEGQQDLTVLCESTESEVVQRLVSGLKARGDEYGTIVLHTIDSDDPPPTSRPVITTLDLESHFFESITPDRFAALQRFCRQFNSNPQRILWLSRPSQLRCTDDPRSSQSVGALRVIRQELSLELYTLELDAAPEGSMSATELARYVSGVLTKVCTAKDNAAVTPEREFAVDPADGILKIGRLVPFSVEEELAAAASAMTAVNGASSKDVVASLDIPKPGMLDTLRWTVSPAVAELPETHVEIDVKAVGLNFRDVVVAMGVVSFGAGHLPFGVECSGVVSRVGSAVKTLRVGDRVMGMASEGCFGTRAVIQDALVVPIPDDMSFEEAATVPAVFTTALYGLVDIGGLKPGMSVLIHSACGGVGHAAVQIAKLVGAEVYVTVGSPEKAAYVEKNMFIPRNRIFRSRDDSFIDDVMRETGGKGVDVALNSLSGKLLHATWRCIAEFGTMVEISKRDLMGHGRLDLEPFLLNRSYRCVDVAHLSDRRPHVVGNLLRRTLDMCSDGLLHPIRPATVFAAQDVEKAFRFMQKGDHIGKVVVSFQEGESVLDTAPAAVSSPSRKRHQQQPVVKFDPSAAYLITGGLGGLGKSLATWMTERGARKLVFLSRSAGKTDDDVSFFEELEVMGCTSVAVAGHAEDRDAVRATVAAAAPSPIRGVVHFAMMQRESGILDMSYADWANTVAPKVDGAWNLHECLAEEAETPGATLDFFLLASSILSVSSQPGLANYAAANCFLESFCQFRRHRGLPASVLGICPIADTGFVAALPSVRRKLTSQGYHFLAEKELLEVVELAIVQSKPGPDELVSVHAAPTPTGEGAAEATGNNPEKAGTPTPEPGASLQSLSNKLSPTAVFTAAAADWQNRGYVVMGLQSTTHLADPRCQATWRRDPRTGSWHNWPRESAAGAGKSAGSGDGDALQAFLGRARADPDEVLGPAAVDGAARFLARQIARRVAALMMREIEEESAEDSGEDSEREGLLKATPAQLGMDSLMAIELRRWWKIVLGIDMSVLEIMGGATLGELGVVTAERLRPRLAGE